MTTTSPSTGPVSPTTSRLRPLPHGALRLTGGYWGEWQERNGSVVLRHCEDWIERIGWAGNFDGAATGEEFTHAGIEFVDSEVYKLLEAMAWELGRTGDPELAERYERLVDRVAAAQDDDGYLHTAFGRPWQRPRWSDLEWGHELYCMGHLIQAAVARLRTAGSGGLVDVAVRVADHLVGVFGDGGREAVCGHPEIEPALVELGRATGDHRYVRLAQLFIDRRGNGLLGPIAFGPEYFQDDLPVRQAGVWRGHAVRAMYLAAGAVDVAVETGDAELVAAVERQWANTVATRTYLTGAMGSHHQDESFGADFELPPDREYGETCAAIASNMVSWRLLLETGESKYADLIERTLYNAMMVAPREDGRAFFYANTMHQRVEGAAPPEDDLSARALSSLRAPWFEVSCCPTNLARTLASVESVFATMTDDGLQLHQYGDYDVDATLPGGATAAFRVCSGWPTAGTVSVEATAASGTPVALRLRVPSWASEAVLETPDGTRSVDGARSVDGTRSVHGEDTVTVVRTFAVGDRVTLTVPVAARLTVPDPRIDAVRGTVAVERGPLVYALESTDLGRDVGDVVVQPGSDPLDDGPDAVRMRVRQRTVHRVGPLPYGDPDVQETEPETVRLVPYATWGNRGPSTMRVFLPVA
ncbi:glycoside hydrolase family 127 protein [Curtobacterium sp. MCBD17_030]|uniref:glycoside hydrolase family 127 protein n=1 Tax=Curtobacterium sp. MCBD17_030 TaxID=2175649 RepID=UPI000D864921|nr:beta-L-arabinofuranosidase domain-containing protein [Curtobacterium sp. MCBD17_030]PYY32637.1 glycoside hydrolase family 127 protein [Curtobacterium sp. MCBD17_030]